MTNLAYLTMRQLGTDRAVLPPTVLSMLYDRRRGYSQVIEYRTRREGYILRVTLPFTATKEGARYTAEVAHGYLMRPDTVPVTQDLGTPLQRAFAPLARCLAQAAPGSPPAARPPQR